LTFRRTAKEKKKKGRKCGLKEADASKKKGKLIEQANEEGASQTNNNG